jgi:hypothetical protein
MFLWMMVMEFMRTGQDAPTGHLATAPAPGYPSGTQSTAVVGR